MEKSFPSKIVGVTIGDRQANIKKHCRPGMPLILIPEPDNPVDENAIGIWVIAPGFLTSKKVQIGYFEARLAGDLSGRMSSGENVTAKITNITGGTKDKPTLGVNILIEVKSNATKPVVPRP